MSITKSKIESDFKKSLKDLEALDSRDNEEAHALATKHLFEAGKHLKLVFDLVKKLSPYQYEDEEKNPFKEFNDSFPDELANVLNIVGVAWNSSSLYC